MDIVMDVQEGGAHHRVRPPYSREFIHCWCGAALKDECACIAAHLAERGDHCILPPIAELDAAKNAATVMPVRSVRIDSPVAVGGSWRVSLLAPQVQGGVVLEVYLMHSGLAALDCASELVCGRQWPRAEQARG